MRGNKRLGLWVIVAALVGGALLFIHHTFEIWVSSSRNMKRGSYAYYVLIRETMRDMPVYKPDDSGPEYYYSMKDGGTPLTNAIVYCATTSRNDVSAFYSAYLERKGFTAIQKDWGVSFDHAGPDRIALSFDLESSCATYVRLQHFIG